MSQSFSQRNNDCDIDNLVYDIPTKMFSQFEKGPSNRALRYRYRPD